MYSRTMSRTFATNGGPGESWKASLRCGCSPKARQIRWMVDGAQPIAAAIGRSDRCVAPGGAVSSVRQTVSAISSSPIFEGVPGRGSSRNPSRRCAVKRQHYFETVSASAPTSAQIALFSRPAPIACPVR